MTRLAHAAMSTSWVTSAMVIHAMDRVDLFPYKQTQMKTVFTAFHRMLEQMARKDA